MAASSDGPYRESLLGLHPRNCRRCPEHGAQLVSLRQRGLFFGDLPLITLGALWRRCTVCANTWAWPRFHVGLPTTLSLLVLFLLGRGWLGVDLVVGGILLGLVWGAWMMARGWEGWYRERLVPLPTTVRRAVRAGQDPAERARRIQAQRRASARSHEREAANARRRSVRLPKTAFRLVRFVVRQRGHALRRRRSRMARPN